MTIGKLGRGSLALVLVMAACGAPPTPRGTTPRAAAFEARVGGLAVVTRERPGGGHFAAGLFVQMRAEPPSLATLAALVLEARASGRLHARATPDGIALRAAARTDELDAVLVAMAAALTTRDVSQEDVERARAHLVARRLGRAGDDRGRAARLAAAALFGADVDVLGSAEDDGGLTVDAVNALLDEAFGADRAMLALIGDVSAGDAEASAARAFAGAPRVRAGDAPLTTLREDVLVEISERDFVSAALSVADEDVAERARGWMSWADPTATVAVFPMRGTTVVLATREGSGDEAAALVARLRRAVARDAAHTPPGAIDVESEVLSLGDAWLALASGATGSGVGVGWVVAGGRADAREPAPEAQPEALRQALLARLSDGRASRSAPVDPEHSEARLASGLQLRAVRVPGVSIAVAVAFEGGARLDPRSEHGRAAVVARMLRRSCEPDAERSWVDASSLGLVLTGDVSDLERTLARTIDCVRRARHEAAHADSARAEALSALGPDGAARAWAAEALAPGAPGLVAPAGSAAGIAAASGLDVAVGTLLAPSRATLTIVGDVDPARAIAIAADFADELPDASTPPFASPPAEIATGDVFVNDPGVASPEVIVTVRVSVGASAVAARATARALADALRRDGAEVHFWFGDAAMGSSFVAVGVRGSDARLDALPSRVPALLAQLGPLADVDAAVAASAREHALASLVDVARALAAPLEESDAVSVAHALSAALPRYVMLRPQSGPMHPPRRR